MTAALPRVTHVASRPGHSFSKTLQPAILLIAGLGVEGDGHAGTTVQHRSRVARDPTQANLRQIHLMAGELHDELNSAGFDLGPGDLGENLTTRGIDLIGLSAGTRLHLGQAAVVEITGLRNPCIQLDAFRPGLMAACLGRDDAGRLVRKAGVMGIVLTGGEVRPEDAIVIESPAVFRALEKV
ncbi:MOSC domain-containing protein [Phenylobacterium sp.]|uniref:MOSC domain-containing protein n=1 Tax=Phenylobacterium sp. TaxID=1871053 RepID=UPI00272F5A84|nr:MOSC domain-containing protein [Phenylobacterium sp.]MDP1875354.1 MOSC domain-containing protein [Phenylobacterium sp.]